MGLVNLNVNITTNANLAASSVAQFGATARTEMNNSARAADTYAARVDAAAQNVSRAADGLGKNMEAANDKVMASSEQGAKSVAKIADAVDKIDTRTFSERFSAAFGTAFGASYAATVTWLDKTEEYVEGKAKTIAIGLAIGVVSATAAAVYTAYKIISGTMSFIEGLFSGEAYKSGNIDALIAANNQVKELQRNLNLTAVEAAATADVLARLGVDKSGYVDTYTKAAAAMRANTDELDRLKVKYKDANGELLTQAEFLGNVKAKLDEYKSGADRAAAAAAISAGSYEAVTNALKVNDEQLNLSKDRLDAYLLAIGPDTQAAVARYEQGMRDFRNESRLTSEGFSRAVADNIMPALTNLASFFQDGFPYAVRVFRYSFATVTSLFFGLQTVVYSVAESVLGSVESIGAGIGGLAVAAGKALAGDFSGAKDALVNGWEDARTRFAQIGANIVEQAKNNRDAMVLAWGLDDRNTSIGAARAAAADDDKGKKTWMPAPKPAVPDPAVQSAFKNFLDDLDRQATKLRENEYAMLRLKAAQLAAKEGITDLGSAYDKINKIQRAESQRAVDAYIEKLSEENNVYAEQIPMLRMTTQQQELATAALKRRHEVEQMIIATAKSGKPLDERAVKDLRERTDTEIAEMQRLITARQTLERDFGFGVDKAVQQYLDDASNGAKQAGELFTNAFRSAEDALTTFATTGKLSIKSLVSSIAADLARLEIRQNIMSPLIKGLGLGSAASFSGSSTDVSASNYENSFDRMNGSSSGGSGLLSSFGSAIMSFLPKFAVGTPYVPRDMLAVVHEGEKITPKGQNSADGGAAAAGDTYVFNGGVTRNDLMSAMQRTRALARGDRLDAYRRGSVA